MFNQVDMSRFFRVTDVNRPVGNARLIQTDDAPRLGVNLQNVRTGAKIITVTFHMLTKTAGEIERLKHELAGVLNVSEPVKLTFSDEPDKYYMAIPIDDCVVDNITRWFQRGELTFLIPDGVAHSNAYRTFSSQTARSQKPKMVIDLENRGNVPAFPIVTVRHRSENGYLGLVNPSGIFELGYRDGGQQRSQTSQLVFDYGTGGDLSLS